MPDGGGAAVFGTDERQRMSARAHARFPSVGLLLTNAPGGRDGTAVLVGDRRILATAHTLFEGGRLRVPLSEYRFRLGPDLAGPSYEEIEIEGVVAAGTREPYRSPQVLSEDWVVVELASAPKSARPTPLAPLLPRVAPGGAVTLAGFHADIRSGLRRIATGCRRLAPPPNAPELEAEILELFRSKAVWLHDCDTAGHSSGAGLFVEAPGGRPRLIALNVGALGPARAPKADPAKALVNLGIEISQAMRVHFDAVEGARE